LIAHGCEVDHCRNAGEVLKEDTRRAKSDFGAGDRGRIPIGHRLDVLTRDGLTVFISKQVFEQDPDGIREGIDALEAGAS
jgi:hypothetical protein